MDKRDVKVVYLLGFGRSGTTVMANVLGEVDGLFHAGELQRIWSRLVPNGMGRCGCGEQVRACAFWAAVLLRLDEILEEGPLYGEGVDPEVMLRWQARVTGRDRMRLRLEDATRRSSLTPAATNYRRVAAAMYRAVADVTGSNVIIDSTKIPQLGILLEGMPGISAHYLHVVRDPRGVLHSRQKRRTQGSRPDRLRLAADAIRWSRDNILAARIRRRVGPERAGLVRYEELVARPALTFEGILQRIGITGTLPMIDEHTAQIGPNHTVCGNRNRFTSGRIAFREDLAWRESLRPADRWIARVFTAPAMRGAGYSRSGPAADRS